MDEFMEKLVGELKNRFGDGYEINPVTVQKNNDMTMKGIRINPVGYQVAPTIYVENFYHQYRSHILSIEMAADLIQQEYHKCPENKSLPIEFKNYEQIKGMIRIMVINFEKNREVLQNRPHKRFLDLAVVAYIVLENVPQPYRGGTVQINNHLLESWGISEEELFEQGLKNMSDEKTVKKISSVLEESGLISSETRKELDKTERSDLEMYVVSNKRKIYGAAHMLDKEIFQKISEENDSEILIYPSSVHELIVVQTNDIDAVLSNLGTNQVEEVNQAQVDTVDQLSNNIYRYDREKKEVSIWKEGNPLLVA